MNIFADFGIYVLASLAPNLGFGDETGQAAYDTAAYNRSVAVINNLGRYTNTLGFFTGMALGDDRAHYVPPLAKVPRQLLLPLRAIF